MKTLVICDMEPVAIEGLRSLLAAADGPRVVAAEICLAAGMDAVRSCRPSLVVIDKAFGMQVVIEALRALGRSDSGTKAMVWGGSISEAEALRLLHAGAAGVARKTSPLEMLLDCVTATASGAAWVEDTLAQPGSEGAARGGHTPLTDREIQVMDLVERGLTNKEIGRELGIRTGTVKIHLKHIFEKTGVRGRYGLALCGLREKGLLLASAAVM